MLDLFGELVFDRHINKIAFCKELSSNKHRILHLFTITERDLGKIGLPTQGYRSLDKYPLLYFPVRTLDSLHLGYRHCNIMKSVIRMQFIQEFKMHGLVFLIDSDRRAMDRAGIRAGIYLRINIKKTKLRQ